MSQHTDLVSPKTTCTAKHCWRSSCSKCNGMERGRDCYWRSALPEVHHKPDYSVIALMQIMILNHLFVSHYKQINKRNIIKQLSLLLLQIFLPCFLVKNALNHISEFLSLLSEKTLPLPTLNLYCQGLWKQKCNYQSNQVWETHFSQFLNLDGILIPTFFVCLFCFLLAPFISLLRSEQHLQNKTLLIFSLWLLLLADLTSHSEETPSPNKCTCKGEKGLTARWGLSLSRFSIHICLECPDVPQPPFQPECSHRYAQGRHIWHICSQSS